MHSSAVKPRGHESLLVARERNVSSLEREGGAQPFSIYRNRHDEEGSDSSPGRLRMTIVVGRSSARLPSSRDLSHQPEPLLKKLHVFDTGGGLSNDGAASASQEVLNEAQHQPYPDHAYRQP